MPDKHIYAELQSFLPAFRVSREVLDSARSDIAAQAPRLWVYSRSARSAPTSAPQVLAVLPHLAQRCVYILPTMTAPAGQHPGACV